MPIACPLLPWDFPEKSLQSTPGSMREVALPWFLWDMEYVIEIRHDIIVGAAGKTDPEGRVRESP